MSASNLAAFTIDGTPSTDPSSGDRQYLAVTGDVLELTLEVNPSPALSVTYSLYDPSDPESPTASRSVRSDATTDTPWASHITFAENGQRSITLSSPNDKVHVALPDGSTIPLPSTSRGSWVVRCTAVGPGGAQIFERGVVLNIDSNNWREAVPAETTQFLSVGYTDLISPEGSGSAPSVGRDILGPLASAKVVQVSGDGTNPVSVLSQLQGDATAGLPPGYKPATVNFASDANLTISNAARAAAVIRFTGTITATRTATWSGFWGAPVIFQNDTAQTVVVAASTGAGYPVLSGSRAELMFDGTNVIAVADNAGTLAAAEAYTDAAVSASVPDATASVKGILRLAGDFAGSATSPLVAKLQGNPVDSTALGAGQDAFVLTWDNTAGKIIAKVVPNGFTAGGDLSGTSTSQTVAKVHGASVPAAGALVTGNAPHVSGTSALTYQALNLAGGSGWVTGVLPAANLPALSGITAPTADVSFNSHKATGLADGVASSDAATVGQLSAVVAGLSQKSACRALASANVASMSGLPTQDGVTLTTGQQIFLNGQMPATQKGPWVVSAGAWVRPPDFLTGASASGAFFVIENGTAFGGTLWICTNTPGSDIVDTSALTFVEMQLLVTVDATMTKTGNQLAVAQATATPSALGVAAVGSSSKSSKEDHVHVMPRLDQVSAPTAAVAFNAQKGTGIANGSASSDVAAYGQVTAGDATAIATSESYTDAQIAASGAGGVFWEPADTAALNAITITSAQVGKFAFKGDDDTLWLSLSAGTGSGHWTEVVGGMLALTGDVVASGTGSVPTQVHAITGVSGTAIVRAPLIGDAANTEPFRFGETGVVFATDADHTATATEYSHPVLGVTSTGSLTATRNLILPATNGAIFFVGNFTTGGQTIIAKTPSGTGVSIPTGSTAVIVCDGTNYFGIAAGSGGSDATSWYGVALDPSMASPSGGSYGAIPIFGGDYGGTSWEFANPKFSLFDFSGAVTPTEGNLTSWGDKDGNLTVGDSGIVASSVITQVSIGGPWGTADNPGNATQRFLSLGASGTTIGVSSWVAPKPGVINVIYVKYASGTTIADNCVFDIFINGTDSGHGCTVVGGTSAANATGLSVSYNAGDLIAIGIKQASTATAVSLNITASLAGS